jgi:uncharacterized protein (UPF0261 family)
VTNDKEIVAESRKGRIAVLATLDTKGDEASFLGDCIRRQGHTSLTIDVGIAGHPTFPGDVTREVIAQEAGRDVREIAAMQRARALEIVASAVTDMLQRMVERHEVAAVLGIGGGTGTWLCTSIMKRLPIGFPKLVVSTLPGHDASIDIAVLPSVADIAGLNRILTPILANAAGAVCGMVERPPFLTPDLKLTIALTMFGVTTQGATIVRRILEDAGCEVVVFHSNGTGGATMESLATAGAFDAVLDWSTTEITDELTGGVCTAGPHRLEAAGLRGLPQLIVPGAIDVINCRGAVPQRFEARAFHMHLPDVPLVRTSEEEARHIGEWIGRKLNAARGPVSVLIPEGGFSALDRPGGVFEDRAANAAFIAGLRTVLRPAIPLEVRPDHINSEPFARAAATAMLALIPSRKSGPV